MKIKYKMEGAKVNIRGWCKVQIYADWCKVQSAKFKVQEFLWREHEQYRETHCYSCSVASGVKFSDSLQPVKDSLQPVKDSGRAGLFRVGCRSVSVGVTEEEL